MLRPLLLLLFLAGNALVAGDEFTLYDLLAPDTHQFAITYDATQDKEGAQFFLNPIRPGSVATKERVIERSTGKELQFQVVDGKQAKSEHLVLDETADKAEFIRVRLTAPVPKGGATRLRIFKTYTDAQSYGLKDGKLVFERPLGIKRNVVLLPKGWEIVECVSPAIVSTDADGRVRASFLNDRDDQLPVKIVARRLP